MTVNVKIVDPTGGKMNMALDENITGNMLKQRVWLTYRKQVDEQVLWFQRNEEDDLKLVEDLKTLKTLGIENDFLIKEGKNLGFKSPEESELRRNIHANGDMSYYYAHSTETPLPDNLRYVSGGDPIPLNSPGAAAKAAAAGAEAQKALEKEAEAFVAKTVYKPVSSFSWCDSDDNVKIYVTQKEVLELLKGRSAEDHQLMVRPVYDDDEFLCEFSEPANDASDAGKRRVIYKLHAKNLDAKIVPEKCKAFRVGGSKVSFTLRKADTSRKWYSLTK